LLPAPGRQEKSRVMPMSTIKKSLSRIQGMLSRFRG